MLNSRDYNGMAKDLANRTSMVGKPSNAYERIDGRRSRRFRPSSSTAAFALRGCGRFGHHDGHPRTA
jgi:hypothetical protein